MLKMYDIVRYFIVYTNVSLRELNNTQFDYIYMYLKPF